MRLVLLALSQLLLGCAAGKPKLAKTYTPGDEKKSWQLPGG
jgi:hypothetical protein